MNSRFEISIAVPHPQSPDPAATGSRVNLAAASHSAALGRPSGPLTGRSTAGRRPAAPHWVVLAFLGIAPCLPLSAVWPAGPLLANESWSAADGQADGDRVAQLAAAKAAIESGDDQKAWAELERLRLANPAFATSQDVDFLLLGCGLRLKQFALTWEASQRWIAAQGASLGETSTGILPWTERRAMLGQAYLAQIQAAYHLALEAPDLAGQLQWLTRGELAGGEFGRLEPDTAFLQPLHYWRNLIALQIELRRDDTAQRQTRLQTLATEFTNTAQETPPPSSTEDWRSKSLYYAAVASEMAGDLPAALKRWSDLLEASTTPAEIRQSTLLALADAHLNRWFVTSRDSADAAAEEGRQVALREARDRFQQLQREFPAFSAAQVTFNYGICLQQLGEHAAAIQQFEKISWPADPQADLAATAVAWQAQFNLARSHFLLGNAQAARQAIDLSLQHLSHATETTGGRAVLLRMRMAQQEEDWATVSALARDGAAWLKSAPDQAPEIEFLQALAQFRSTDAAEKLWGANRLTELAQIAQHPFANQAKFCLIPWQLESATPSPHRAARVDLDRKIIADLRPRIVAAAQAATDLLASADLNVDDLPVNATLWLPAQRDRYERRKQVQMWQADALFKLQDHSRAEAAYAKLRGAYADDPAAPMWAIKQAISLAQSPAPQDSGSSIPAPANLTAALDLLSEAVLATWPKEPQADGWFIRGELLRLKADPAAAVLAYQRAADSFAQPADQIMALGEVVQIWQTEEKHAEIVQLADRWMPSLSGSGQAFMSLQRGIAHHHLKNPAAAEADFARVQEIASSTPSADEDDHKRVQELLADAVFNRGLMLQQLQRASAAKDLWESFLADQRHGETRRLLDERLSELLPKWRESEVGTEQIAETSGSQKMASLSIDELLTLAEQQFQQQQWPAAIQTLEHLNQQAQEDDRHDKVLYLWGWALREQKLLAEARSAWEKLIELHIASPWIARAQFHLGELAYQAGNYPVAANHFQSSRTVSAEPQVQRNSLYMEAWSDLNRDLFEAAGNKFQMVIDSATETDREHPLVWESHALVGQCHYRAQQWNLALQSFQSATPQLEKLQSHKPDLYFMSCFNAGRAALALEQPGQAIGWLTRCSLMDPTALSELADAADLIAEAKLLLAATLRMTNDPAGAQSQLLELTPRSDRFGLRALVEMAEVAKSQGDESNVRRSFQAAANGAFGPNLSPRDIDLKARALLEVGLSFLRTAQQQTDTAVAAEHLRQAKTWLARAQIQTDSATVSQEAQQQLQRLGTTR